MTHVGGEDDVKQAVELPIWARVVVKEEDNIWAV